MKSAYEIAMARLEKESGPTKKLTDQQKAEIAEIDNACQARTAEQRLSYEQKMAQAQSVDDLNQLKAEMAEAIAGLEAQREKAKEAIWNAE